MTHKNTKIKQEKVAWNHSRVKPNFFCSSLTKQQYDWTRVTRDVHQACMHKWDTLSSTRLSHSNLNRPTGQFHPKESLVPLAAEQNNLWTSNKTLRLWHPAKTDDCRSSQVLTPGTRAKRPQASSKGCCKVSLTHQSPLWHHKGPGSEGGLKHILAKKQSKQKRERLDFSNLQSQTRFHLHNNVNL